MVQHEQVVINDRHIEKETQTAKHSDREIACTNKVGGGGCSDVMAWLASPLGHS